MNKEFASAQAEKIFKQLDEDGNGELDEEEFCRFCIVMMMMRRMTIVIEFFTFQGVHTRPRSDEIAEVKRKRFKGATDIKCCFSLIDYQGAEEEKE